LNTQRLLSLRRRGGSGGFLRGRSAAYAAASAILLLIAQGSCDRAAAPVESERRAIIITTLYPLADIARQVGGDRVRADWLLDLGDPIEQFTLSRPDADQLSRTDFIICDGLDRTETWAREDLARFRNTQRLITVDQVVGPNEAPADGLLCLDPVFAGRAAKLIADALGKKFPKDSDKFHERADAFAKQLEDTLAGFKAPSGVQVVVLSNLFQPFLARLGVKQVLVAADPLNLGRTEIESIRRTAQTNDAKVLIVPFDTPPGRLLYLQEQTGLKPVALDALGYPNFGDHAAYLEIFRFNLDQLRLATR
jgi:ABC-type Zn uptake system ZnuABC Zn-binding protein ZnuA